MDLEEQILRYYIKVFSIFSLIFFTLTLMNVSIFFNKKFVLSQNIISIKQGEKLEEILKKNIININSFEIKNVLIEKGETGVDIDSKAELSFQDGFKSKIHASYKKNLGSKSLIHGEKGTILLNKSWSGGNIIIHLKGNSEEKINFANNKNIYSYQIEEISKNLIKGLNKINFPIMSLEETLINMKIIDGWLNYCET